MYFILNFSMLESVIFWFLEMIGFFFIISLIENILILDIGLLKYYYWLNLYIFEIFNFLYIFCYKLNW